VWKSIDDILDAKKALRPATNHSKFDAFCLVNCVLGHQLPRLLRLDRVSEDIAGVLLSALLLVLHYDVLGDAELAPLDDVDVRRGGSFLEEVLLPNSLPFFEEGYHLLAGAS